MMIFRNFIIIVLSLSLVCSCNSDNNSHPVCNSENPLEDLTWLKEIKTVFELNMSIAGTQIIQYQYKGEYVFWIDDCFHCADGLVVVRNCDEEIICEFGGIDGRNTCPDFQEHATDSTMLLDLVQH